MSSLLWKAGASLCLTGIGCGAFGAHLLGPRLGDKISVWSTGAQYLMFNGAALLAISQHPVYSRKLGGKLILAGTLCFSGSIFALLLLGKERVRFLGPVTPLGGVLMLAGYTTLLL
ncbi:DUF423-domain-containing protein [Meredithblackwellia eburnea MCA 4105]